MDVSCNRNKRTSVTGFLTINYGISDYQLRDFRLSVTGFLTISYGISDYQLRDFWLSVMGFLTISYGISDYQLWDFWLSVTGFLNISYGISDYQLQDYWLSVMGFLTIRYGIFDYQVKKGSGIERLLPSVSPEAVELIYLMCTYDPDEWITAKEAVRHHYFKELRYVLNNTHTLVSECWRKKEERRKWFYLTILLTSHLHDVCHTSAMSLSNTEHVWGNESEREREKCFI